MEVVFKLMALLGIAILIGLFFAAVVKILSK